MENCLKLIRQIDKSHRGLGIYLTLIQLCVNVRRSVFVIAPSGSGKKVLVNSVKTPQHIGKNLDMKIDSITATQIYNTLGYLQDKSILWRIEDFATLRDWHRTTLVTIGSKLISDHCYYRDMGTPGQAKIIDIKNCWLTMILAIQPITLADLINREKMWEALGNDRFLKLLIINPLRTGENDNLPVFEPIKLESINFDNVPESPILTKIFKNQVSDGRVNKWCRDLISSYLTYEGYSDYKEKYEQEFIQLFGEILQVFTKVSFTESLEQPIKVAGGSLMLLNEIAKHNNNGGITQIELANTFRVYKPRLTEEDSMHENNSSNDSRLDTIRYHSKVLLANSLIKKENIDNQVSYRLSDNLTSFYKWYEGIIS